MKNRNTSIASTKSSQQTRTYVTHKNCSNCGYPTHLEIPFGTTIAEYLYSKLCSNCGCRLARSSMTFPAYENETSILEPKLGCIYTETSIWKGLEDPLSKYWEPKNAEKK